MPDSTLSARTPRAEHGLRGQRSHPPGSGSQPVEVDAHKAADPVLQRFPRHGEPLALIVSSSPTLSQQLSTLARAVSLEPCPTDGFEESCGFLDRDAVKFILVDMGLPADGAMRLCRRQADRNGPPLVVVGERADQIDRIVALEVGADDLFALPLHEREFVARVRALMRRSIVKNEPGDSSRVIAFAGRREIRGQKGSARLSAGTWRLLLLLAKATDKVITVQDLLDDKAFSDDGNVRSAVSRQRRKLTEIGEPNAIVSFRPGGYGLNCTVEVRR